MARTKGIPTLKDVKLDEISFVGKGDNPEAHIVLLKGKNLTLKEIEKNFKGKSDVEFFNVWCENHPQYLSKEEAKTFSEIITDQEIRNKIWSMIYTLEDSVSSIMYDEECEDKKGKIQQTVDEFKSAITSLTKEKTDMSVELKKKLDEAEAKVAELTKENETLKAACASKDEENEKLKKELKKDEQTEAIDKSALPENVRKQLETLEKENSDNKAAIAKIRDDEMEREYIGKAAEVMTIGKADEIGSILKSVAQVSKDAAEKVFGLLKDADAKIRKSGLFKEHGAETESDGPSAYDKIVAKASELRKSKPELTDAQAFRSVYDSDHELRKQYLDERKSR